MAPRAPLLGMAMIKIKSEKEVRAMADGGKILAEIMRRLEEMVAPGISGRELNKAAEGLVFKYGAKPSFKGYKAAASGRPFPAALCVSVNEQIVHAVPSDRKLEEGDIVSLDLGIFWRGFHSDMAVTLPVGEVSPEARRLLRAAKKALKRGIRKARPGAAFGDIGNAVQRHAESQGFSIVRDLCGHGIGREIHEEPQILNYGRRRKGEKIRKGMVFCIEPMLAAGSWKIKKSGDGFGFETADGSLSAHFEHTVAVAERSARVLTALNG